MGAIRNPEAGLMEALRTLRAVPGVIAPVRLSLILLACGGTRYIGFWAFLSVSRTPGF